MTLKQTIVSSMVCIGVLLGIVLPGQEFALPLGFLLAAVILHLFGFQPENEICTIRSLQMSRDVWIVSNVNPVTSSALILSLQCFPRLEEWEELIVYRDHPQFKIFCNLDPAWIVEFSYHPDMMKGARTQTISAYLSIFKIHPPGSFIPPKSGGSLTPATVH